MVRLLLGDCLERMAEIPDGSVDMVCCDLPYGTTACKWDAIIPFEPLWAHYRRVCRPNAAIVLTASQPFTSALVMSNPEWFKYSLVWEKGNGTNFLNVKHQPMKVHEDVLVFSSASASFCKGITMTYLPQMEDGNPYQATSKYSQSGHMTFHTAPTSRKRDNTGTRYPRSVMRFKAERGLHPTQKPVSLMEYLIRTYTNAGETVLDSTMGSGTTGVAAANTGRAFIGIERDPAYFAIAEQRIAKAQPQLPMAAE